MRKIVLTALAGGLALAGSAVLQPAAAEGSSAGFSSPFHVSKTGHRGFRRGFHGTFPSIHRKGYRGHTYRRGFRGHKSHVHRHRGFRSRGFHRRHFRGFRSRRDGV